MEKFKPLKSSEYKGKRGIYSLINTTTGTRYIGHSSDIQSRLNSHGRDLINQKHTNFWLQEDWNRYGVRAFAFEVLELVEEKEDLPYREKFYISKFEETGVYNSNDPVKDEQGYEDVQQRREFKKPKSFKHWRKYKYTRQQILDYLENNYKDKMLALHKHIGKRVYYIIDIVDDWFLENIEDEDIRTDERLIYLLEQWYRKSGFTIVKSFEIKKLLRDKYGAKKIPRKDVLVARRLYKDIERRKIEQKKINSIKRKKRKETRKRFL